ncbi:MAG: pyruvate kinase alpha/beta domain-containing protein, partial [Clostridium sp.]|nr:pyruvate kinase alpha/beta domain-containing protein [Clostridium sp.]
YPVECVKTMVKIANRAEQEIRYWRRFDINEDLSLKNLEEHVAYATCITAKNMKADAIVCYTHTGDSARNLAGLGAACPILAITDNKKTFNQLSIVWNVTPIYIEPKATIDDTIEAGLTKFEQQGILEKGDLVILAGGYKIVQNSDSEINKTLGGIYKI